MSAVFSVLVNPLMHPDLGALWQWGAITLLGLLMARIESQRRDDRAETVLSNAKRDALLQQHNDQARKIDRLDTLVGTNGNGIIARLDAMNHKLDQVLNEQAELRGAASALHHPRGQHD